MGETLGVVSKPQGVMACWGRLAGLLLILVCYATSTTMPADESWQERSEATRQTRADVDQEFESALTLIGGGVKQEEVSPAQWNVLQGHIRETKKVAPDVYRLAQYFVQRQGGAETNSQSATKFNDVTPLQMYAFNKVFLTLKKTLGPIEHIKAMTKKGAQRVIKAVSKAKANGFQRQPGALDGCGCSPGTGWSTSRAKACNPEVPSSCSAATGCLPGSKTNALEAANCQESARRVQQGLDDAKKTLAHIKDGIAQPSTHRV